MKKITALLLALILTLALGACGSDPIHQEEKISREVGPESFAVLVEVDPNTRSFTIRDAGQEEVWGDGLVTIDCLEAPVYEEDNVAEEFSFLDLEPGDKVKLFLGEKARKALQKGETTAIADKVLLMKAPDFRTPPTE